MSCRLLISFILGLAVSISARAQSADVIRGQVTSVTGPVPNAAVTATATNSGLRRQARTDSSGRYTITFQNGEGDYFLTVTAIGFAQKQLQLKRLADEGILIGDVVMTATSTVLDTIRVLAPRERVTRAALNGSDISGTEQAVANGIVPGRQQGDLNAIVGTIAGVTPVPGADGDPAGFSVFGLSPDQNNTMLNGLPFGGTSLPRDANVSLTMAMSPYDVSRGSFSGGQVSVRTRSGSNFLARNSSLNVDRPTLQWTGPAARQLGQPYESASIGGVMSGPVVLDKLFYNFAYQADRRTMDLRTLLNASPQALNADGVAPDSVARFLSVLSRLGIPAVVARSPADQRGTDAASFLASLDFNPAASPSSHALSLVLGAKWNRDAPLAQLPTDVPARAGTNESWSGNWQLMHSAYVRSIVLTETTVGMSGSGGSGTPFVHLPSGTVRINSVLDDGSLGLASTGFGGSPSLPTNGKMMDVSLLNQSSWFSLNNRHRIKATAEVHRQWQTDDRRVNRLGSFDFNSLGDLESGRPAQFVRSIGGAAQYSAVTIGALSLGDAYKPTSDFQVQYGVRLDANRYSQQPTLNTSALDLLHVRNDNVPNRIAISPRIGFSWAYGSLARVNAFDGAATVRRGVVRGGLGVFQNVAGPGLISSALQTSGTNGSIRRIRCVGPAVPIPDWSLYLADPTQIPSACADGATGDSFASTAPSLEFFAPDFRAPRSIRGNLQWTGPVLADRLNATIEGAYSRNEHQRSFVDRNFSGVEKFSLTAEDQRPAFVDPGSIDPQTGATAFNASRTTQVFGRVVENVSDLRSHSRQFRVTLTPATFNANATWNVSYVYASGREQTHGFTSTASNPRDVTWARADLDAKHAFTYNLAVNLFDAVRLTWSGRTASGLPFTPMIGGDVNGDGYANDRAFIFDPAAVRDSATSSALRSLLQTAPELVRECLEKQRGTIAGRNSCESGWTSTASMGLSLNSIRFHLPQRLSVGLLVDNPLGAADLLFHGQNGLRGWGAYTRPDQNLFFVKGFDPSAREYRYVANSNFGSTHQLGSFGRPITATLSLHLDVGPSRERQILTQLLDRGRKNGDQRASGGLLKAMFGSGGIVNPLFQLLRDGETIHLVGVQADSLAIMNLAFTAALDSVWTDFATYAATLPAEYDQGQVYERFRRARRASVDLLIAVAPRVKRLLTEDQRRQLAPAIASYLETRYLAGIRSGSEGNSPGGPFANAAWAGPSNSGTGQRTDIIRIRP